MKILLIISILSSLPLLSHARDRKENIIYITGIGKTSREARLQAQMAANRQNFKTVSWSSSRNKNGDCVVILKASRDY